MSISTNKTWVLNKDIAVIGFDLDQTLYPKSKKIDLAIQSYLYKKISQHLKISLAEAQKTFNRLYKDGSGLSGSKIMELLKIPDAKNSIQKALENANIEKFLRPNSKAISLLISLKKRYKNLDIITGSNTKITKKKLYKLNIPTSLFNHIITSEDSSKSDSQAYKMWMKYYPNLKPKNFLYIGDRVSSDFIIPNSLGINTILVNQKDNKRSIKCLQLKSLLNLKMIL